MNRDLIMQALAAQLALVPGIQTRGRKYLWYTEVNSQPALFVVDRNDEYPGGSYLKPRLLSIGAHVVLYTNAASAKAAGFDPGDNTVNAQMQQMNLLIDQVEAALLPSVFRSPETLALTPILRARIEGTIEKSPGSLGDQAIAWLPISILVGEALN